MSYTFPRRLFDGAEAQLGGLPLFTVTVGPTPVTMAAAAASVAATSSALTKAATLATAAASEATTTSALTAVAGGVAQALAAAAASVATGTSALAKASTLATAALAQATGASALIKATSVATVAAASASTTGALTKAMALTATVASSASAVGALLDAITLTGASLDANFAQVSLLLHMDGANGGTTFLDSSPMANTVSRDTVTTSTTQNQFGGASTAFATVGGLSVPSASNLIGTSGDFTIEFWMHPTATPPPTGYYLFANSPSYVTLADLLIVFNTASKIQLLASTDGSTWALNALTTGTIALNTWTHVAVVRSGSNYSVYLDGTSSLSATLGSATFGATGPYVIGAVGTAYTNAYNGYLDEFRITKGVARYTGTFTPSVLAFPEGGTPLLIAATATATAALTQSSASVVTMAAAASTSATATGALLDAITFEGSGDPYWGTTVLAVNFDAGTAADAKGHTVATETNVTANTGKFNGGYGAASAAVSRISYGTSADWNLDTGDWTFSAWVKADAGVPTRTDILSIFDPTFKTALQIERLGTTLEATVGAADGVTTFQDTSNANGALPDNTWVYIEVCRNGTDIELWVGGSLYSTMTIGTVALWWSASTELSLGGNWADRYWPGSIDDVRLTKGIARRTTVVPTAEFLGSGSPGVVAVAQATVTADLTTVAGGVAVTLATDAASAAAAVTMLTKTAPLASSAAATATGTAALTAASTLATAAGASASSSGALALTTSLASVGAAQATGTAALTDTIPLATSAQAVATTTSALTQAAAGVASLAASAVAQAASSSALTDTVPLASASASVATASAALTHAVQLAAAGAAQALVTSAPTHTVQLATAAAASATATSALTAAAANVVSLAAAATAAAASTSALTKATTLASASLSSASTTAALTNTTRLASAPAAVAATTSALSASANKTFAAAAAASGSASAALFIAQALETAAAAQASTTAVFSLAKIMAAAALAQASSTLDLNVSLPYTPEPLRTVHVPPDLRGIIVASELRLSAVPEEIRNILTTV